MSIIVMFLKFYFIFYCVLVCVIVYVGCLSGVISDDDDETMMMMISTLQFTAKPSSPSFLVVSYLV